MVPNTLTAPSTSSPSSPVTPEWSEKKGWPQSPETDGSVTAVDEDVPDRDPESMLPLSVILAKGNLISTRPAKDES